MIDPAKQHELEQARAVIVEYWPPLLRQFFLALVAEGFPEGFALYLTVEYLKASLGGTK